eukprot:gb/GECG01015604.1/.p1 GENE.gb/GECG01015604.1/~~gb/GECG01015604.1/.p1  ORF type:complete len:734 (+),score=92.48 gb/GECG01015604.1/:1-2202(+)
MTSEPKDDRRCTFKIHEFIAYDEDQEGPQDSVTGDTGAVAALAIGPTSGQLLATASASGRVITLWKIGRQAALGHLHIRNSNNSVPTVIGFDHYEHKLLVGTSRGQLRLYDLQQWKQVRSISASQAAVTCVDWHPLNPFLIGCGTKDNRVKVFDTRTKQEFQVACEHEGPITIVRFSPDGRWLVTGSGDCQLKVWDLTKGEIVHTFRNHRAPVQTICFHPTEFVLASADTSGVIQVYELQELKSLCACAMDSPAGIHLLRFAESPPELFAKEEVEEHEVVLLGVSEDKFRVWDVARYQTQDNDEQGTIPLLDEVVVQWSNLQDVWIGATKRKTSQETQSGLPYHLHMLGVGSTNSVVSIWGADMMRVRPFLLNTNGTRNLRETEVHPQHDAGKSKMGGDKIDPSLLGAPGEDDHSIESSVDEEKDAEEEGKTSVDVSAAEESNRPEQSPKDPPSSGEIGKHEAFRTKPIQKWSRQRLIPSRREKPIGLNVRDFLPKTSPGLQATAVVASLGGKVGMQAVNRRDARLRAHNQRKPSLAAQQVNQPSQKSANQTVDEILHKSEESKESCVPVLSERLMSIRTLANLWTAGDLTGVVEYLQSCNDHSVIVDVLRVAHLSGSGMSLDMTSQTLPVLKRILNRKFSDYQEVALKTSFSLCKSFGTVIASTLSSGGAPYLGVDVAGEERVQKCQDAFDGFVSVYKKALSMRQNSNSKVSQLASEVVELFEAQLPIGNAV